MEIKLLREVFSEGSFIVNKTRKYLFPSMYHYGKDFITNLQSFEHILACGLEDHSEYNPGVGYTDKQIFCLFAISRKQKGDFVRALERVKGHSAYITDYLWGDPLYDVFHMLVFEIPDQYAESYQYFLKSQYSRMYTSRQVKSLFVKKTTKARRGTKLYHMIARYNLMTRDAFLVLTKSEEKREALSNNLKVYVPEDTEYDEHIHPDREIFHYYEENVNPKLNEILQKKLITF